MTSDQNELNCMVYDYLTGVNAKLGEKFKKETKLNLEKRTTGEKRSLLDIFRKRNDSERYVIKKINFNQKISPDSGHESGEKKRKKVGTPLAKSTPSVTSKKALL